MANEFLVEKWKVWYKALDVNHDGKISVEDVEEAISKFSQLHHLEADTRKKSNEKFEDWWKTYIFHGKYRDISEEQFVEANNADFKAGKEKFVEKMRKCFDIIFDVIDTNQDKSISEKEFLIAFDSYGHENVALDTKFFQAYNPVNGLVPLITIRDSWVDFTTSEDASKRSLVKDALEGGA